MNDLIKDFCKIENKPCKDSLIYLLTNKLCLLRLEEDKLKKDFEKYKIEHDVSYLEQEYDFNFNLIRLQEREIKKALSDIITLEKYI